MTQPHLSAADRVSGPPCAGTSVRRCMPQGFVILTAKPVRRSRRKGPAAGTWPGRSRCRRRPGPGFGPETGAGPGLSACPAPGRRPCPRTPRQSRPPRPRPPRRSSKRLPETPVSLPGITLSDEGGQGERARADMAPVASDCDGRRDLHGSGVLGRPGREHFQVTGPGRPAAALAYVEGIGRANIVGYERSCWDTPRGRWRRSWARTWSTWRPTRRPSSRSSLTGTARKTWDRPWKPRGSRCAPGTTDRSVKDLEMNERNVALRPSARADARPAGQGPPVRPAGACPSAAGSSG